MSYKVYLKDEAAEDFRRLDSSVKKQVAKQLKKLEETSHLGAPLGNMRGFDLTGYYKLYYKLYAAKKSIRIVYRIIDDEILVEIVGIGKRANFEVYAEVAKRLLKKD